MKKEVEKHVWSVSVLLYHPQKGFLLGLNDKGKYEMISEQTLSKDNEMIEILSRGFIRETLLYENYYIQRRIEKFIEWRWGLKIDINEFIDDMRERYLVKDRRKYDTNEISKKVKLIEGVMREFIREWFDIGYRTTEFEINIIERNDVYKSHVVILDISQLTFGSDINALSNLDIYYNKIENGNKYKMKEYRWRRLDDINENNSSEMLNRMKNYLFMGEVC